MRTWKNVRCPETTEVPSGNRETGYEAARVTGACTFLVGRCLQKTLQLCTPCEVVTYPRMSSRGGWMTETRRNGRQTYRDWSAIYNKSCEQTRIISVNR